MSSVNTLLPTAAVQGTSSTTSTNTNAFNSLTPSDFINMMVTQLENQDPLNPTNSQDLLSQMSSIGQLQSADSLQTTLAGVTLQNQIGSASSLIGKEVQGTDANSNPQTGIVQSISITPSTTSSSGQPTGGSVSLNLNTGATVPLGNVTAITAAPASATAPAVATPTTTSTNPIASALQSVLSVFSPQPAPATTTTTTTAAPALSTATTSG